MTHLKTLIQIIAVCLLVGACQEDIVPPPLPNELVDAQGRVILEGSIRKNKTLTANKKYILYDEVYVKEGATLTIEPGTVIFGDKTTKAVLVIQKGGQIVAEGTAEKPIVFTSAQPKGSRNAGDWGGIVLMGNAPVNRPNPRPEGGLNGTYGGDDAQDNSGILKYVRIEFAGASLTEIANSEINALTLYGVGKGTMIDYVQTSFCNDDCFEWFGGTVNAQHLIAHRGLDDDFDTDFGYTGSVQFAVSLRDPAKSDQSTSNGFESDNYDPGTINGTDGTPQTAPNFANVSIFLNKEQLPVNSLHGRGMHLRRNTSLSCYNSVFVGHPEGLRLDGTLTYNNIVANTLKLQGIYLINNNTALKEANGVSATALATWFDTTSFKNNRTTTLANALLNVNTFHLTNPDFRPQVGSPLLVSANTVVVPTGLIQTNYIGAFDGAIDWTALWANFDPQNTDY
jgi:hypothetical protein